MEKSKTTESFLIEPDQKEWLESMAAEHNLPDASKALRILLDYAIQVGEEKIIFDTVRCRRCG